MDRLGKYFNSNTFRGRANVAKATYVSLALIYSYFRLKRNDHQNATKVPSFKGSSQTDTIKSDKSPSCTCRIDTPGDYSNEIKSQEDNNSSASKQKFKAELDEDDDDCDVDENPQSIVKDEDDICEEV